MTPREKFNEAARRQRQDREREERIKPAPEPVRKVRTLSATPSAVRCRRLRPGAEEARRLTAQGYLTLTEVADRFNRHPSAIHRVVAAGLIPSIRVGNNRLFLPSDIEKYLADTAKEKKANMLRNRKSPASKHPKETP